LCSLIADTLRRQSDAQELVCSVEVRCRSFSLRGSFLGNVHILFTTAFLLPCPTGLRLETAVKIDKKKTELYFSSHEKNFLTEKEKRACHPERQKHTLMARSEV